MYRPSWIWGIVWPVASCRVGSAFWTDEIAGPWLFFAYLDPGGQRVCLSWHDLDVLLKLGLYMDEKSVLIIASLQSSQRPS